jgi:GDP-4-dehydro-6-deoxy-D-mannose reductase
MKRFGPERILVTGAAGFVGKPLVSKLEAAFPQSSIYAIQRSELMPVTSAPSRISYVKADLFRDDLEALFQSLRPDVVIHLAAISSVHQSLGSGGTAFEENLIGGVRLIRAMRKNTPRAALVFASSGEVYGRSFLTTPMADELTPIFPNNPYARSKAALEFAIQDMFCDGGRAIILRLFNHFGPGQDERFVIASFASQLRAIAMGAAPTIRVGNLEAKRDFLPVADVLDAYVAATNQVFSNDASSCEIYNVASGKPRTIASVLDDLITASGLTVNVEEDATRMRPSEVTMAAGDARRFTERFGWTPKAAWESSLSSLVRI